MSSAAHQRGAAARAVGTLLREAAGGAQARLR
jgi:hypothetical protein